MEAMTEYILKVMIDGSDFKFPTVNIAMEIAEHLEGYDKWKLENCTPYYEVKWTLYDRDDDVKGYFTNSELYQYYKDNILNK